MMQYCMMYMKHPSVNGITMIYDDDASAFRLIDVEYSRWYRYATRAILHFKDYFNYLEYMRKRPEADINIGCQMKLW